MIYQKVRRTYFEYILYLLESLEKRHFNFFSVSKAAVGAVNILFAKTHAGNGSIKSNGWVRIVAL